MWFYSMLILPLRTLEFKKSPASILTKEVKRGEAVVYEVDYCKYIDNPAELTLAFVDGIMYPQPKSYTNVPRGCRTTQLETPIPYHLPSGEYYIDLTIEYKVNAIRTVTHNLQTEKFVVLNENVSPTAPSAASSDSTIINGSSINPPTTVNQFDTTTQNFPNNQTNQPTSTPGPAPSSQPNPTAPISPVPLPSVVPGFLDSLLKRLGN